MKRNGRMLCVGSAKERQSQLWRQESLMTMKHQARMERESLLQTRLKKQNKTHQKETSKIKGEED